KIIKINNKKIIRTIKKDLRRLKKQYANERLTTIEAEIEEIKINIEVTVPQETCIVSVTEEGYIKRTSLRSYGASNKENLMIKSTERLVRLIELDTTDNILLFTNFGKYVCIPVHELAEIRWKDMGNHLSNITTFEANEKVVNIIPVREFIKDQYITFITKQGMVKKTE